ncbi:HU domain-containing protein [Neolewinella agarilytica]|uniref:CCDC81-like prokaryotic HU domain-containing protein n=1 Tax=Neolewinella agarilytica TaxID=478744 RepID=A0A1H8Z3Y7_9BACT|nr:hypothetical protein [Neolewinella agarilytica]SEP59106.1 hypothetical protein SAMN05444359_101166 [Neolewinella agarilytica]
MSKQITDIIRGILMEEDQVCLPGIGTLRLTPQPALISPIEGKATPPSEQVSFNANLVLDDGRILRGLTESTALDRTAAQAELAAFLEQTKENLDAGRSVTLEGIGRLFRHFDGQLRFTAGGDNFSKASFGLPAVDIRPIARTEKRAATSDPMLGTPLAASTDTAPASAPQKKAPGGILYDPELRKILWYVAAFLGSIALLCLLYLLGTTIASALNDEPTPIVQTDEGPAPQPPIIRKPLPPVDAGRVVPDDPPRLRQTDSEDKPDRSYQQTEPAAQNNTDQTTTTTPTPARSSTSSSSNVALIATGLYGSSRNVEKNIARIKAAGYDAFSSPDGRYTRVGVRLEYQTEEERFNALNRIRRLFSEDAFVWELNGERMSVQ